MRAVHQSLVDHPDLELDPRVWRLGSEVTIHATSAKKSEVRIDLGKAGGGKSRIHYDDRHFTLEDVQAAFAACFEVRITTLNALLATVLTGSCTGEEPPESECNDPVGEKARKGAGYGALWGVGFAIVGLAIGTTWEDSPLPGLSVTVGLQRSGVGMSLSVTF